MQRLRTSFGGYCISYPALQLSKELSPLPPAVARTKKRKHCSCSWLSGMFNYLIRAQKGFWCLRIKVCIAEGIGSHICKLCRCSKGVRAKTLMGVLLSRGWNFPPVSPGPDLILPIPIRLTDFCNCIFHPSISILSLWIFWFRVHYRRFDPRSPNLRSVKVLNSTITRQRKSSRSCNHVQHSCKVKKIHRWSKQLQMNFRVCKLID